MLQLVVRTRRIHRGWVDRLRGFEKLYESKISDGQRIIYGRGETRQSSEQAALRTWQAKFGSNPLRNSIGCLQAPEQPSP
jgi:hypothetical protein